MKTAARTAIILGLASLLANRSQAMAQLPMAALSPASVTINDDGSVFVGAADVQAALALTARQLQEREALVAFRLVGRTETVTEWSCVKRTTVRSQDGTLQQVREVRPMRNRTRSQTVTTLRARTAHADALLSGFALQRQGDAVEVAPTEGPATGTCTDAQDGFERIGDITTMVNELGDSALETRTAGSPWKRIAMP